MLKTLHMQPDNQYIWIYTLYLHHFLFHSFFYYLIVFLLLKPFTHLQPKIHWSKTPSI